MLVIAKYSSSRRIREVRIIHNTTLQENAWLLEMLHRSLHIKCRLCMQRHVFIRLCNVLSSEDYLLNLQYISIYKQVAMFLLIIGNNFRNFLVQDVFQHSAHTFLPLFQLRKLFHIDQGKRTSVPKISWLFAH